MKYYKKSSRKFERTVPVRTHPKTSADVYRDWNELQKEFHNENHSDSDVHWKDARDQSVAQRAKPAFVKKPHTENHKKYIAAIEQHVITFGFGAPGTGKTFLACEVAVRMLKAGEVTKIVIARPMVTVEEDLGYLPGDIREKTEPYVASVIEILKELLGASELEKLRETEVVEVVPLAVMRGRTFHSCAVLIDEAENATAGQLRMAMTRIGQNTKMMINGDLRQTDLKYGCPLLEVIERLQEPPLNEDIAFVELTAADSFRPFLIQFVDERLHGPRNIQSVEDLGEVPSYGSITKKPAKPKAAKKVV